MGAKVLIISNLPTKDPRSVGGVTAINKILLEYLTKENVLFKHVQARKYWFPGGQYVTSLFLLFKVLIKSRRFDVVSIHATQDMHLSLGVWVTFFVRCVLRKKVVYHFFAGSFKETYLGYFRFVKTLVDKTVLKSDTVFFETKELVTFFDEKCNNCVWLPNARKKELEALVYKEYSKKLVFISRVTQSKGVQVLLDAFNKLDSTYSLDVFGPCSTSFDWGRASYKGVLDLKGVSKTISNYDLLVLPTFHNGEGYPGVFIEAMSVGTPVITTQWKTLGELVEDNKNGRLIPIKDVDALVTAIESIDDFEYQKLREGSFNSFQQFDVDFVYRKLIKSYYA